MSLGLLISDDPPMDDSDMTDDQRELFRKADRMSHESQSERLAWLLQLRQQLRDHPRVDSIIQSLTDYMDSHRKVSATKLQLAHVSEYLEADFYDRLESLLAMPPENFSTSLSLKGLAQIAILSHLLEPLRCRCQSPDAQEKLRLVFQWLLNQQDGERGVG